MFLKEIEMQGFKSFADKTRVTFDRGVTAVVGPNGSGKSNITESLRWALGESSAKSLRGGKMPDVIFAGTQDRKPLNYASVKVVLDNSDGFLADAKETVSVERHIYRNGDSDYLIDGKKVRLKDIHDLFMDTGLGRDSFSIISQGRVEAIFNSKPEERRAIFEEAAGVLKYKTRKKETQTKLNQTQDNLDRLEDIIYELDSQVKPLENQAKKAKIFLDLDKERSSLQLSLLVADIYANKDREESLQTDLEQAKLNLADYHRQRQQLEDQNQALKTKRQKLTDEQAQTQNNLVELTRLAGDLKAKIERYQLEEEQGQRSKAEADQRLKDLRLNLRQVESDLQTSRGQAQALQAEQEQVNQTIQGLQEELSRFSQSPDQIIESLREKYVALLQEEADLSNRLTLLEAEKEQERKQAADSQQKAEQLAEDLKMTRQATEQALVDFQTAQGQVANLLKVYQELDREVATNRQTYQTQQSQYFDLLNRIKGLEAKKASLEAIQKNHSNFYAGVRSVLNASDQLPGILGAVSQQLTFDTSYQTALEIALGASSQHIIVSDEEAAKAAIGYLRSNRQGRATFLPLTTIKPRSLASHQLEKLQSVSGFLGMAVDLVTFDQQFANIFQNLLGVTAIFETTDQANQAARQLNYQVRLVTLDGTEIRPGGAFSGGANRQQSTTFIQPELDQLTQDIDSQKRTAQELENQLSDLKTRLSQQEEELLTIKEDGNQARLAEQKTQLTYQQLSDQLSDLQKTYDLLQEFAPENGESSLFGDLARLQERLEQVATDKESLTAEIDRLKTDKDSVENRMTELRQGLEEQRLRQRDLAAEWRFEASTQQRLTEEMNKLQSEEAGLLHILSTEETTLSPEKIQQVQQQLADTQARQQEEETKSVRLRFELEDCEGALEDVADRLTKLSQQNDDFIRQQATLEAQLEQVGAKLQGFARQLAEDFQMSLTEAANQSSDLEDIGQARQSLKDLQRQIKALGPINLESIEQFEEVNDRLTFLSGQRDDLLEAKNMLQATIDDMDGEVKARFKTTFEAIRESFKTTFSQMFGGGSADLILTDKDILTAGVEISVQPPGKKIQSLNLMSGGEKALSALALLFAIIRVKTIPFVILDEVEAALDEANVKRFGDYLNRFDKSSQFIVVTHRKGTMAAADSIYGVTMQESGVSKILSVKLKDAQKLVK